MDITNLNVDNLPDVTELERLANQLFMETPNQHNADEYIYQSIDRTSVLQHNPVFPSSATDTAAIIPVLTDKDYVGTGKIPDSVAGSGMAPSALTQHQNNFDIADPQTSLPDPHFYNGQIPQSVAGSGKSPSLQTHQTENADKPPQNHQAPIGNQIYLPFEQEQYFENQLQKTLNNIHTQLCEHVHSVTGVPYYFLNAESNYHAHQSLDFTNSFKPPFDINRIRSDFPILKEKVNGKPLIWLDNAATTQKPKQVIDRINEFYEHENSNIHRAAHELAARATDAYEAARLKVQHFLHARSVNEIVFVRGTTEAINLVAQSWGDQHLGQGDEVIISYLEHHANIVPWQLLSAKKGFKLRVIPVDNQGQIILEEYAKLLNPKTKLVSFTQVSNALGTVTPAKVMIDMAHAIGAKVLLDGAQSVSHMRSDVQYLNPDWFVFSGHKVFGPTGIGVLYGKEDLLNSMQPWQGGGNMIQDVTFEHTQFHQSPARFEAGTGNIADAVGLGAAIDYVTKIGIDHIAQYEHALLGYATKLLGEVTGLRLIGTAPDKTSVLSFVLDGFTNEEVGIALNKYGIALRTGHHCAQPILRRFGLESTVRPSLAFYNTCSDIDTLVFALQQLKNNGKRYFM